MRQRLVWLLGACLVGLAVWIGYQQRSIATMEAQLGEYWSNELSGSYFSRLGELSQALNRLSDGQPLKEDERLRLLSQTSRMAAAISNTLADVRKLRPDSPEPRHLRGYLRDLDSSVLRVRPEAPLDEDLRQEFQRHARLLATFIELMPKHFAGYQPDGGLTSSDAYWGRSFLTDPGWRAAIMEMDAKADEAHYFPW